MSIELFHQLKQLRRDLEALAQRIAALEQKRPILKLKKDSDGR